MRVLIKIVALLAIAGLLLPAAGCSGNGSRSECEKDGDCPSNWRCDIYAKVCRCINDEACVAPDQRCMPDGSCQVYTGCSTDQECGSCKRCEAATGECLCTDDCACGEDEFCNSSGFCQPRTGCFDNADCSDGEYCDTPSKSCVPTGTCSTKFQCPLGQICPSGTCVPGCQDHGDCPFHEACMNGSCQAGVCPDDSFCEFMEACMGGNCVDAYDDQYAPYCKPCNNVQQDPCGEATNLCLIYPYDNDGFPSDNYCGVDCSGGQRCPVGFECSTVILVAGSCRSDAECSMYNVPCLIGEEDNGFCPCNNQTNPCPANNCFMGMCSASGDSCSSNADCIQLVCEYYEGYDYGGCVYAKNCGLKEGYHCP